jgi:hypothetical protein
MRTRISFSRELWCQARPIGSHTSLVPWADGQVIDSDGRANPRETVRFLNSQNLKVCWAEFEI